jgi:hypothetical protein
MRAAYGTMLQERRRVARISVDIPVAVRASKLGIVDGRVSDLSVGGLALQCARPLHIDCEVSMMFALPGTDSLVHVAGRVVNGNTTGRAGVRFSFVPEDDLALLESWLARELAKLENAEMPVRQAIIATDDEDTEVVGPLSNSSNITRPLIRCKNQGEN